jgi:hypothetical protein
MTTAFPETAASWARLKTVWREMITDYRRLKAVKHLGKAIDVWPMETLQDQLVMRLLGNVTDAMGPEGRKVCDAVEREAKS